jgi:hypothetical protein
MNEIEKAKAVLRDAGFYVDNLWTTDDVKGIFKCDDNIAQEILDMSLTNEATMEQIHFSIREFSSIKGLEEY